MMKLLLTRPTWPDPAPEYVRSIEEAVAKFAFFYRLCSHDDCTPCTERRQRQQIALESQSEWLPDQNRYACSDGQKHNSHLLRDGSECLGRSYDMT